MADMEEKVQYQSDERLRDVNEVLENCQTRVSDQVFFTICHLIHFLSYPLFRYKKWSIYLNNSM